MKVRDVKTAIDAFGTLFPGSVPYQIEYSDPWHFCEAEKVRIPFEHDRGFYLYSKPTAPNWRVPLDQNDSLVWYIGKSDAALAARVWSHMGWIKEPGTAQRPKPLFKFNRWADQKAFPKVPPKVRHAVAEGKVVVYTIKVWPRGAAPGWPSILEKYLLVSAYRDDQKLPPLNIGV